MDTITRTLFEEPFWFLVGLGLVEVVLIAMWHGRRTKGLGRALVIPIVVGLVVVLTAALVETDRERMVDSLERLAADLEAGNVDVLADMLDEKVLVDLGDYGGDGMGKARSIDEASRAIRRYAVTSIRVKNVSVEMTQRPIMTATTVVVGGPGVAAPLLWRIHWIERDGQWRILEVERPRMTLGLK